MRRIVLFVLCLLLLAVPVFAAEPNSAQIQASVNTDGSCQMSLQLAITPDGHADSLVIPLGTGAKKAMVEGASVRIRKVDGVPSVVLSREGGYSGRVVVNLTYTLTGCIDAENRWRLSVPLLAEGFAYPLDVVSFRITMPGEFEETPDFISGYLGNNVDNYMTIRIEDKTILGTVETALRDRESLTFQIDTNASLFPRSNEAGRIYPVARIICYVLLGLMLLYWVICLRWRIAFRAPQQPQAPEGVGAGEVCGRLLAQSPDLPLMILSWAQAGYLTIHLSADNAVTLHKRMDMGNERSDYEGRLFRELFGYGLVAETTDAHFRRLRQQVEASLPRVRGLFRRKGGRVLWVRVLGAAAGLVGGIAMGDMLIGPTTGRLLPILGLGLVCAVLSWVIQAGPVSLYSWDLRPGVLSAAAAAVVLGLGLLSGCLVLAMPLVLGLLAGGLLTVFGGQRTEYGRQNVLAILGFRDYLRFITTKDITRIMDQRPGYYYDMAPYALALGVDRQFANHFGTSRLPDCGWLVEDIPQGNRAPEWYPVLRLVVQIMRGRSSRQYTKPKADALYEEDFQA